MKLRWLKEGLTDSSLAKNPAGHRYFFSREFRRQPALSDNTGEVGDFDTPALPTWVDQHIITIRILEV